MLDKIFNFFIIKKENNRKCLTIHGKNRKVNLYRREILKEKNNDKTSLSKFFANVPSLFDCRTPKKELIWVFC